MRRVVLHVGVMKSGTSSIQAALFASRDALAAAGVMVPGQTWQDQVRAVMDLLERRHFGEQDVTGAWDDLVSQIAAHEGTAVVSMEFLAPGARERLERGVATLRATGAEVEVVITARDLNRNLAAMWQEGLQNGWSFTWADYRDLVRRGRPRAERPDADLTAPARMFWRQQNLPRVTRKWARLVGAGSVTVVTVPPPGAEPGLLLDRFGQAAGLPAGCLFAGPNANASLGAASAVVLQRINAGLEDLDLAYPQGAVLRKHVLAKEVLSSHRAQDAPIGLEVEGWVRDHAREMSTALRGLGVRLVGDWSDLDPLPQPGVDPDEIPPAAVQDAAITSLVGLLAHQMREESARR